MKKLISLLCLAFLFVLLVPTAYAISYADVDSTSTQGKAILKMTENGILNGYPNGTFQPKETLTRAEFVKIVNKTFGFKLEDDLMIPFSDVEKTNWAYSEIRIAQKAGYIQGEGNHIFSPGKQLTRQEVCVILNRINHYQNFLGQQIVIKDKVADWAKDSVEAAIACGLFSYPTDGKFRGTEPITRGEMCEAVVQYVSNHTDVVEPQPQPTPGTPIVILPDDGTHTKEEQAKEAEVAAYLSDIVSEYNKYNLEDISDDDFVNQTIRLLMDSLREALDNRKNGAFLSPDYINKTFTDEIKQFKENYHSMTPEQTTLAKSVISRFAVISAIETVTEYFDINT
jgi:hypothetical protein